MSYLNFKLEYYGIKWCSSIRTDKCHDIRKLKKLSRGKLLQVPIDERKK